VDRLLLINAVEPEEVRVALVEDGRLEELYVEAGADPVGKGNIYVGRVANVEKGIGAAFVDLGGGLTGFLHASDVATRAAAEAGGAPAAPPGDGEERPEPERVGTPEEPEATPEEASVPADVPVAAGPPGAPGTGPEGEPAGAAAAASPAAGGNRPRRGDARRIQDLLKPEDRLLVQVSRGPVGHKGPALTTRISLAGRYVVLLANSTRSGVSRRIESAEDRGRMRSLLGGLELPEGMAAILRTASHGRRREDVQADLDALFRLWEELKARLLEGGGPRLVHAESDLALRAVRDVLPAASTRIVIDDRRTADRVREFLARTAPPPAPAPPEEPAPPPADAAPAAAAPAPAPVAPAAADGLGPPLSGYAVSAADAAVATEPPPPPLPPPPTLPPVHEVSLHDDPMPLFHAHGIEGQVEDAFRRTIRLPSGGSIVIDPTEALVAIDVNSGRLTEEEDLEATALKTDLEAVAEVARQLRLRDLGGVIVVDFIDLQESAHSHQVEQALREALKRDRARIRLGRMGPFGCLELTRQRIRPALASVTHVTCPSCHGTGRRRHPVGVALRVLREVESRVARSRGSGGLEVRVTPAVADVLRRRKARSLERVERRMTGPLRVEGDPSIPYGAWSIKGIPPKASAARTGAETT
jgi:ribonuclease E